jgi:hypothetical protein
MAELISKGNAESLWLLKKNKYPGSTDLHIHQHSKGLTVTAVYKGHKEHLDIDRYQTVEDFGNTLDYFYHKLIQKYGKP